MIRALPFLLLGCADPVWQLSLSVDPPLDLPSEAADGCTVTVDALSLAVTQRWLEVDHRADGSDATWAVDLEPVRQYSPQLAVPPGRFATVRVATGAPHLHSTPVGNPLSRFVDLLWSERAGAFVVGRARCEERTVSFAWTLPAHSEQRCATPALEVGPTGALIVPAVARTDVLFEGEPGVLMPRALVDADLNGDGELTLAELRATPIGNTGWAAGPREGTLGQAIANRSGRLLALPALACVPVDAER